LATWRVSLKGASSAMGSACSSSNKSRLSSSAALNSACLQHPRVCLPRWSHTSSASLCYTLGYTAGQTHQYSCPKCIAKVDRHHSATSLHHQQVCQVPVSQAHQIASSRRRSKTCCIRGSNGQPCLGM
jgi:hypothetical protein